MNNGTDPVPTLDQELYPALIQCFFIIGMGYIAGQLNLLSNTHSIGLSRYVSNFALPAVIFKNLVDVQFQSVSWRFLASVLIAKTIIFVFTMLFTFIAERPRNFASMGQYAIMTTQSNDFALILPIIDAVYRQSHPDFSRYVYLIAPISLIILNPIGFCLIEVQKRIDDQRKHRHRSWQQCQLMSNVCRSISRNPIVICTLLGVLFNIMFSQKLPYVMEYVLTPIAQSFSATALFFLGLSMVGKLSRLHAHLVITVCLLNLIKLVIFPLVLRQAVFFLLKPLNGSLNATIDYSNLGFLYGTAPIAPSVVFYVPEASLALQSVTSTSLVVSTLLAGPIILVSAKMINLRALDVKTKESYELLLTRTAYDVSILSLFCTIIVLIGFCLRRRWLRVSFIHKYTFIFVGLQMIHALWTIVIHHVKQPLTPSASAVLDIGGILIAFTTRTWATSLSFILMMIICHSVARTRQYSWLYHLFAWSVPLCLSLAIYFHSSIDRSKVDPTVGVEKFGKIQIILSITLLVVCISINSISLLRIARRTYRLRHDSNVDRRSSSGSNEGRPLIDGEEEMEIPTRAGSLASLSIPYTRHIIVQEIRPLEEDSQLLRHGILVTFLTIDAFVCLSALLWLLLAHDRDGVYYELQFLDTVLLHGQGIISFLIFALDADFLLPITRTFMKLLRRCSGANASRSVTTAPRQPLEDAESQEFECKIRPDFIRHSLTTQNASESLGTIFNGSEFCQWLMQHDYVHGEEMARAYLQKLIIQKQLICVNQMANDTELDVSTQWFVFSTKDQ